MAQRASRLDQKKLCCSICLDLMKIPVTIPCGHNYCMNCIKTHWDGEDQKKIYSCPQCRKTMLRPALVKNTMLADLVEELKKAGLQAAPVDHCCAGSEDVARDHLQPHCESPPFEKHRLVKPSLRLKKNICSRHNEAMKIFCRTDQQCICIICSIDEHKGHNTVSATTERTERQRELGVVRQKIQKRIQYREKDVKVLQQEVEAINHSAEEAVRDSENIFTDVKQQIRSRQKTEVSGARELQDNMEKEIAELKRKDAELERLSHTEDHTQFLYTYPSLSQVSESTDSPKIQSRTLLYFEEVMAAVSEVRDKLKNIRSGECIRISLSKTEADVLPPQAERETRSEFLQHSCQITLDPNTANTQLLLSEGNRKAKCISKKMFYPPHPDRFTSRHQVLSRESLTGRCYWEVVWSGGALSVAVTHTNISRTGDESLFGHNDKSWALECFKNGYELRHNKIRTSVSGPQFSRIGVYLDHSAGILCFYGISKTMTLLHRVQTTFAQPLCAGFWIYVGSSVELCDLK